MMFKFLILLFGFIFLFGFLFGFSVLRMMFKAIFGVQTAPRKSSSNQQKAKQTTKKTADPPAKKIFSHDEGEYVDYEEIKE